MPDDELEHFESLAIDFSKRHIQPMFEGEHSDGDQEAVPVILDKAFELGIAVSPDPSSEGREYGIWGTSIDSSGLLSSMILLQRIAEQCGGIAMLLHAQGLSANILLQSGKTIPGNPKRLTLCLQEGNMPPYFQSIISPKEEVPTSIQTTAYEADKRYQLNGEKHYCYSMPGTDAYVLMARVDDKWGCFVVPAGADGITITDVGPRTGLRACDLHHVVFNNVEIPKNARIDDGDAMKLIWRALSINWIGMSAIAAGIANGALKAARNYTEARYQGGKLIQGHAAIKSLLSESGSSARSASNSLCSLQDVDLNAIQTLKESAMEKLTGINLSARAVTDALQCFGGYGYMEDYGMEKRLRDITVLKSAAGSPFFLKQFIGDLELKGGGQ